ncbi:hypothetical protein [Streptomyces noursei]|uniref:hypothetical protein n=1 Tax=Streptomyces noursei TaxID=1971 RepID=UPI000383EEFC|nr:hypothetical protein [Streptomyces noursei]EPY93109.1 hypothetical protein K530_49820 [Streptomyces noursei CCRC 11814]UWS75624.1 hypothetical protein N1H47_32955 [Streptomyces noursei]
MDAAGNQVARARDIVETARIIPHVWRLSSIPWPIVIPTWTEFDLVALITSRQPLVTVA